MIDVKVKNINGRFARCKCKSWLVHWEKYSREKATCCAEKSCFEVATVGALVQKVSIIDCGWYVIPLCDKH
ncbi:MAG: hypothetical protein PHW13_11310, partial [Methylococcales bacterium]|nr:hypothetical protein [Methylococcales bacterium]